MTRSADQREDPYAYLTEADKFRAKLEDSLDEFTRGYIEAGLWVSYAHDDVTGEEHESLG